MTTTTATMQGSGLFAWLDTQGKEASARLRELMTEAHALAFAEFVSGGRAKTAGRIDMDGGLYMRFSERAYDVLGLTKRGDAYTRRKRRFFGRDLPYRSPSRKGQIQMKDLLRFRGTGWQIRPAGRRTVVATKLTLPGLRQLNQIRAPFGQQYRNEFLQLGTRARHQFTAIRDRAHQIFFELLTAEIERTPMKVL